MPGFARSLVRAAARRNTRFLSRVRFCDSCSQVSAPPWGVEEARRQNVNRLSGRGFVR